MIRIERVEEATAALAPEQWARFGGSEIAANLAVLAGYAAASAEPVCVASLWDATGAALRGLAVALVGGAPTRLSVFLPGSFVCTHARGFFVREGEDHAAVLRALIGALLQHARAEGLGRMLVLNAEVEDATLLTAAQSLGGQVVEADPDHVLRLSPEDSFETYALRLNPKRAWALRRDPRRPAEHGARLICTLDPPAELLDRLWPLQLRAYDEKGALQRFRANLFRTTIERLPPGSMRLVHCDGADGRLLGFVLSYRSGATTVWSHVANVPPDEAPFSVYSAVVAAWLSGEISDGARTLYLGTTSDEFKRRLRCTEVPLVHLYWPQDGS